MRKYIERADYKSSLIFLQKEIERGKIIYPSYENIFLSYFINRPKVVIVGQDPYYNGRFEHGVYTPYATGVGLESNTVKIPQSLEVFYKLLIIDEKIRFGDDFTYTYLPNKLDYLLEQGVMLTNLILTVEHNLPYSHSVFNYIGNEIAPNWEKFTTTVMYNLSYDNWNIPMVFILMGDAPSIIKNYIHRNHLCITCPHPARKNSARFTGIHPFLRANEYLTYNQETPIKWMV